MRAHTRLEVYWSRLADNWGRIQQLAPRARVMPMIKADAYGHGMVPVGQFLHHELKASVLGVATLGEAEAFLHQSPKFSGQLMVFSETCITDKELHTRYQGEKIIPVVHDIAALDVFLNDRCFKHLPLCLKVNTGMNRLGLEETEWEAAGKKIRSAGRSIHHLMSHFARSAEKLGPADKTHRQAESFRRARALFENQGIDVIETSLANSGAIEQQFACEETWVRPGLMLYGPHSFQGSTEMVSSLVTRIMKVFPVKRGVPVGYGVNVTPDDGVVAVLPIGYGDGLPTQLMGYPVTVNGVAGKIFGRINMDMAFIFFPSEAWGQVQVGDEVRFWDRDTVGIEAWAKYLGTHAYQALCSISGRVPRVYRLG